MKILFLLLFCCSAVFAINPSNTTGFVSTNFANAEIEASKAEEVKDVDRNETAERRNISTKGKGNGAKIKAKPLVAGGFFVLGAVFAYLGYDSHKDAEKYHSEYENSTNLADIERLKEKISDSEKKRNIFYGVSGASLVGLTLTLTLF